MKKLLIFLLCSVLVFSSLSFAAGAAEIELNDTAADADIAEQSADTDTAQVGATADEISPTGWSLLTDQKRYYAENAPGVVIERITMDEFIMMMLKGETL